MSTNAETIENREQTAIKTGTLLKLRALGYHFVKRTFDIVFALVGVIAASPLFLIVAIAIKTTSKGPVFFRQRRTGRGGKEFDILKFRSMVADNDVRDLSKGDQYTTVGKFIRRTSIDELPQLINIVKGEMSFVGPRPWIPEYWQNMNDEQRERNSVRPGITGLAQVMGRNSINIFDKIGYDLEYVQSASVLMDLKVMVFTIKTAVVGKSVSNGKSGIAEDIEDLKKKNHRS